MTSTDTPLGGVHGGGVPQLDVGGDVVGRQGDLAAGAGVLHDQGPGAARVQHGPPVTVLHPVGRCGMQAAVVAAGDDGVPDRGVVAVGQGDLVGGSRGSVQAVVAGALVELGDKLPGGGEHDRVPSLRPVRTPRLKDVLGHGGQVTDVHPTGIEVEPQRGGATVAQLQGGAALGDPGEAHQLGQVQGTVGGADVAQHPSGTDRCQLLVVPDQPHRRTPGGDERHRLVQGQGVDHPGLVDDHQGPFVDALSPGGELFGVVLQVPDQLGQGVGLGVGVLPQHRGGGRGRGESDDGPAG